MLGTTGFFTVDASEAEQAIAERERTGWRIFRLPTNISSTNGFFEGVRDTLPLDPELRRNRSWDALADSLWSGLDRLSDSKIVVVWPDASLLEVHDPEGSAIAMSIFADLPASLADAEITVGDTKQLLVLRVI